MTDYRSAPTLRTERLVLSPLRVEDATEMGAVLADERLHEFIGGHPATLEKLCHRYHQLVAGPPDPSEVWLNWIVRRRAKRTAVGTVQATITDGAKAAAVVAWVIGVRWQNRGFATEAAMALVAWLRSQGIGRISANIHREHHASASVAARVGFEPTADQCGGETVWRLRATELT